MTTQGKVKKEPPLLQMLDADDTLANPSSSASSLASSQKATASTTTKKENVSSSSAVVKKENVSSSSDVVKKENFASSSASAVASSSDDELADLVLGRAKSSSKATFFKVTSSEAASSKDTKRSTATKGKSKNGNTSLLDELDGIDLEPLTGPSSSNAYSTGPPTSSTGATDGKRKGPSYSSDDSDSKPVLKASKASKSAGASSSRVKLDVEESDSHDSDKSEQDWNLDDLNPKPRPVKKSTVAASHTVVRKKREKSYHDSQEVVRSLKAQIGNERFTRLRNVPVVVITIETVLLFWLTTPGAQTDNPFVSSLFDEVRSLFARLQLIVVAASGLPAGEWADDITRWASGEASRYIWRAMSAREGWYQRGRCPTRESATSFRAGVRCLVDYGQQLVAEFEAKYSEQDVHDSVWTAFTRARSAILFNGSYDVPLRWTPLPPIFAPRTTSSSDTA